MGQELMGWVVGGIGWVLGTVMGMVGVGIGSLGGEVWLVVGMATYLAYLTRVGR